MKKINLLTALLSLSLASSAFAGVVYIEESSDQDGNGVIHFQAELEASSRLYLSSSVIGGAADLASARADATALLDTVEITDAVIELGKYSQAKSTGSVSACADMESSDGMTGYTSIAAINVDDDASFAGGSSTAICSPTPEGTGQRMSFSVPVGFRMENSGVDAKILVENISGDPVAGDGTSATFDNVKVLSSLMAIPVAQDLMPADLSVELLKDTASLFQYGDAGELTFSLELDLEPGAVSAASVATDIQITVQAQ
jgi:hypothetical protein